MLTLIIGLGYFKFVSNHPLEILFTIFAYLSNSLTIYILIFVVLIVFYLLRLPKIIFVLLFFIINLLVFIDVSIYKIFRFHINGLVLNTVFTKGGWESLEFSYSTKLFLAGVIIFLFLLEFFMYNYLAKPISTSVYSIKKKYVFLVLILVVLIIGIDKGFYACADLKNIPYITRHLKLFPLYQPLTIKKFAQKYLHLKIDKPVMLVLDKKYSGLNYPKKKLEFYRTHKPLPNIIWLFSDSYRYDMLNKDITPNIHKFSKNSLVFENHYSGGNCTRFGIFSVFYGLHGYYWNTILAERQSPVFIDSLIELGYDFQILSASKLTFPEFDKTCFVRIPAAKINDEPVGKTKNEKDFAITESFIKYLNHPRSPFFAFLFFDSPHGSYDFPANFEKFKPTVPAFNYLLLNKENVLPVFNRYKNANYYVDSLINKIIVQLKKQNLLKNTIILITADHGEAFFEKGFYGHNHGFCEEQVKVPLVLYIPGLKPQKYKKLTSHQDIVPALLSVLGCKNLSSDYCNGISLLNIPEREFVVSATWDEMAVIDKRFTIVLPIETYNISGIKIYDTGYKEILDKTDTEYSIRRLIKFQKEITNFMK